MIRALLLICLSLLLGCATVAPAPVASPLPKLRVTPASFGDTVQWNQHLLVKHGEQTQELDALLSITPEHVRLVGLAMNMRVLTLDYDGQTISEQRNPLLPKEVDSERVLSDILLTYWPQAALAATLPTGWTLVDQQRQRILSYDSTPVVIITYGSDDRRSGRADLRNLRYDYEIWIDSVPA